MKTKQHSQATTIENLKSETSWEFNALLIKYTECILGSILRYWQAFIIAGLNLIFVNAQWAKNRQKCN